VGSDRLHYPERDGFVAPLLATTPFAVAVHEGTRTIPLIFLSVDDPVALDLVESLAHPGGNVTGFALVVVEASKPDQLETAFEAAHTKGAEAIHVFGDPLVPPYIVAQADEVIQ
jgi:putative ABC transport system substrate-binding protein